MPLSNYSLDQFVSSQLSELTECHTISVSERFPQSAFWVSNFTLNSIIGNPIKEHRRTLSFFFLRRAEAAFTEYERACQALHAFVNAPSKQPSVYFQALHHFEMTIAMVWQAFDFILGVAKTKVFDKGDDSHYERLNKIYNTSRHFKPSDLSAGQFHAVRIDNDGIRIDKCMLSFSELEKILIELGVIADDVSKGGSKS